MDNQDRILNLIDGKLVEPASGDYLDNVEPATGRVYSKVANSNAQDVDNAVQAAKRAYPAWRKTSPEKRAEILNKLGDLIEENKEAFIRAETIDNGKPLSLSRNLDIPRGIKNLRIFADAAIGLKERSDVFEKDESSTYTMRQPIGIVSIISPWNLPFLLFTWKLSPALAAGNCVIAKPSEMTPMTAFMLSKLANDAGIPAGVLSVLHGAGASVGNAITEHPDITAISFTGGTQTGIEIYSKAAKQLKKVSLELGGKNPAIVFADADFDKAIEGTKTAAFANQGQVCLCCSRLFIHASIFDRFRDAFVKAVKNIKIGDPLEDTTNHGANVSEAHMTKILDYIELAKKEGGTILTGGKRHIVKGRCEEGYFVEPTVIEGLSQDCCVNNEEIFGPVVTLIPFEDEDEVVEMANATQYGLAASIWTQDEDRAQRMAEKIDSGIIWLNCWNVRDLDAPFGGMKKSGIGREGKWRAMEFFTEEKTISRLKPPKP